MITPFCTNIVVEIPKRGDTQETDTGLLLPGSTAVANELPDRGVLAAKGPWVEMSIEVGDTLFIRTYGWQSFIEGDKEYLVGPEEGVLGKL